MGCRHTNRAGSREHLARLAAYKLGAVDFLSKPILPEILSSKARMFIDLARKAELIREHATVLESERKS